MCELLNNVELTYNVWQAIEGEGHLLVGEKCTLEYLSKADDGIFPNEKSWNSFLNGNFRNGEYMLDTPKQSTIKKWCVDEKEYKSLFVVKVGENSYIKVNEEDVLLEFDYQLWYSKGSHLPTSVELLVTAKIK